MQLHSLLQYMDWPNHPCQDLSLTSRVGERWKDIPGLDDRYSISNFGRVKRESFELLRCWNFCRTSQREPSAFSGVHLEKNG
jgi:hypothetical protein